MTETNQTKESTDPSDYDINPKELDYETVCRTYDSANSRTNYLAKVANSDIWVAYRTWQTGPSETSFSIKGVGRLSVSGVSLDTERMAEDIRKSASRDIRDDKDEWDETDKKLSELVKNADEVAEILGSEWQEGSEQVVYDSILDGVAGVSETTAWVSHVEEAFHHESNWAIKDAGLENDQHDLVREHVRETLSVASSRYRGRWLKPHLEYVVNLEFSVEADELRELEG